MNNFEKTLITLTEAKADSITIEKDSSTGEYRVPSPDGYEDGACYCDTKEDAISTAKAMYKNKELTIKFRSVKEFCGGKYEKMKPKSARKCKK